MSFPKIEIVIANGQLGGVNQTNDGIVGIIVCVPTKPSGMTFGTAKQYTRLSAIEADGLDAAYDVAHSTTAHKQLKELYSMNPNAVVWLMPLVNTEIMKDICDKADTQKYLFNLHKASGYALNAAGVCRTPDGAYTEAHTHGLDDDAIDAAVKAQSLCVDMIAQGTPLVVIIEGRDYKGVAGDLLDLKTCSYNHVGIMIGETSATDKSASVGLVLGAISLLPVHRNIGRVRNGALPLTAAYTSDGTLVDNDADLESIHNKGYITIRKFLNRSGYYFSDDPLAVADTDDFNTISRRRVINKAVRVAFDTYTDNINDEIDLADDGTILPVAAKAIQSELDRALRNSMSDNISALQVTVDPVQNVISAGKLIIRLRIVPKGQSKDIYIDLGFTTSIS